MEFTIGNKETPWIGLNDQADGYDGQIGTFSDLHNVVPNRSEYSLVSRKGFQLDADLPSVGHGLKDGLTIERIYKPFYHKVTRPDSTVIRILPTITSHVQESTTSGDRTFYMFRLFQRPYWNGSIMVDDWKEMEYWMYSYEANAICTQIQANLFGFAASTWNPSVFKEDLLDGRFILQTPAPGGFTTPYQHLSEADYISGGAYENDIDWDDGSGDFQFILQTIGTHAWPTGTPGTMTTRVTKNHETGVIEYEKAVSDDIDDFDSLKINYCAQGEVLVLSFKDFGTQALNFSLQFNYLKNTFFSQGGNIYGEFDSIHYDGSTYSYCYSEFLTTRFPNYATIVNAFSADIKIGGFTFSINTYDPVSGLIKVSGDASGGTLDYVLEDRSVGFSIDDFIVTEFDIHGRNESKIGFMDTVKTFIHDWDRSDKAFITGGLNDGYPATAGYQSFTIPAGPATLVFHKGISARYNGYKMGFHSSYDHFVLDDATKPLLAFAPTIHFFFNKNIDGYALSTTMGDNNSATAPYPENVAVAKTIVFDNLKDTAFNFYVGGGSSIPVDSQYSFAKSIIIDKTMTLNVDYGGNHLVLTGNPDYFFTKNDKNRTSLAEWTDNWMRNDFSFGFEQMVILRGMMFAARAKFQMLQFGTTSGEVIEDNANVYRTGFGKLGSNYHFYDSPLAKIGASEIGEVIAIAILNFPQAVGQGIQEDHNVLLILAENGFQSIEFSESDPTIIARTITSKSDCCVAPSSVVSEGGFVFCAGNNGIYMFSGSARIDISASEGGVVGNSNINKTWRELSKTKKQSAIGTFYRERKWYVLCIPGDQKFFIFDLEKRLIFTWGFDSETTLFPTDAFTTGFFFDAGGAVYFIDGGMVNAFLAAAQDQCFLTYDYTPMFVLMDEY